MNPLMINRFRKMLLDERQRLLGSSLHSIKAEIAVSSDDLPDETDLAATEVNQHLVFRLKNRERQLISKIDEALQRMDTGRFGVCVECEEPIEKGRLEVRPMSTHCLACKEVQERRERIYA